MHWQETVVYVLGGLSLAVPFLEWVVAQTPTDVDNKVLDVLKTVLKFVPHVTVGALK